MPHSQMDVPFVHWQEQCQQRVQKILDDRLCHYPNRSQLFAAMRYSVLSPGKRLRPCLIYATQELLTIPDDIADQLAAVVEVVHVYSLIHDDLPAMDDDDLRRGKPACHKQFNEAIAILAGDALQVLAFEWLCELELAAPITIKLCQSLSKAIGAKGMAEGQALDMYWSDDALLNQSENQPTLEDLQNMHRLKTGQLFTACIDMCLIASENKSFVIALRKFAHHIGIAFQIQDDILDVIGNSAKIGKKVGSDQQANKLTYPSLMGLNTSKEQRDHHYEQAIKCLELIEYPAHCSKRLMELAQQMIYSKVNVTSV